MILKILKKDIIVLFSERRNLMIFILMPIILTTILSFSLKGSFGESGKFDAIKVGIVKAYDKEAEVAYFKTKISSYVDINTVIPQENNLDFEKVFFQDFLGNDGVKTIMTSVVMTDEEAQNALLKGEIVAVFYLPKNFIYDQLINFTMPYRNEIHIKMISDPDAQYASQIAESVMMSYFDLMNEKVIQKNVFIEVGASYLDIQTLLSHMGDLMDPNGEGTMDLYGRDNSNQSGIQYETLNGDKAVDSFTYYSIAMMSMFILYASGYVGRELLREKKMQTLSRGTVAGITKVMVLTSKFLMTLILCMVQMSFLLIYAKLVLKVNWERPLMMAVGIFFSALAVSGLGIFISAITLTQDSYKVANIFENVLIHIFALFGGSYIPLEVLPSAVVKLKFIALNGVVLDLFLSIYKGVELGKLISQLGLLTLISICFSVVAVWIVIKKEAQDYA
ncbi:ABC transporter permease [Fusibacter sp. 3D3]|uniref:ABC transporter permease n=1 Tax=Fusibacter sp. 3D3 TaxID=1048380 RepID=UPI000853A0A7|nr:ABC transporter permease [Fusibacter sp. 3D3]GAU76285.1 streptolysin S export transmembrane permease SagH [Fusibacter sp. 3D3]